MCKRKAKWSATAQRTQLLSSAHRHHNARASQPRMRGLFPEVTASFSSKLTKSCNLNGVGGSTPFRFHSSACEIPGSRQPLGRFACPKEWGDERARGAALAHQELGPIPRTNVCLQKQAVQSLVTFLAPLEQRRRASRLEAPPREAFAEVQVAHKAKR